MKRADERYFASLEARLDEAMAVAEEAKARGGDPAPEVEIPVAKDMADRVENILGIDGVADRVRELEGQMSREEAALELVEDFVAGRVGDYESDAGTIEGAVRTAVALLTEGVVAAPIEGIDRVELVDNDDGTQFVRVFYAGPIRSAGGTAQALSVLVADYARTLLGVDRYKPRDDEVERYVEELGLYDDETGLQYSPKDEETRFIAQHCPICLDGEATGEEEVSGFRDLERVGTNNPRGGMCLVLGEGIAQKAPKIQRYTSGLEEVDWPWLEDYLDGDIGDGNSGDPDDGSGATDDGDAEVVADDENAGDEDASDETADDGAEAAGAERAADEPGGPPRVEPASKFLRDLIAGRPVFGHPSRPGGFRLRYGRARNHGFATAGVHPATMHVVDDFLAAGTQLKTERPGKAAGVVPVDSIEGPTVKLANGDVRRIDDTDEAREVRNGVVAILDLGEYLVNYGEFVENNHPLAPASYTVDWWAEDLAHAGADVQALRDDPHVDLADPTAAEALEWATTYDCPLHPAYTYLWHDLSVDGFDALADAVAQGHYAEADGAVRESTDGADAADRTLVVPRSDAVCGALETLLVEHSQAPDTVTIPDAVPLIRSLGLTTDLERTWRADDLSDAARAWDGGDNAVRAANEVAPFALQERAPTRIGGRMGRPEKSEKRELSPAVHTLFPISEAGGDQRDVTKATKHVDGQRGRAGQVEVMVAHRQCDDCGTRTYEARCRDCDGRTHAVYECEDCGVTTAPDESGRAECPRCERTVEPVAFETVDLAGAYERALAAVGERPGSFPILKGVKGLTSAEKVPEPMEKGILRSKHGVSAFKDGTVRYDMTDLPVTAVRPSELDVTADQLRELGYETDVDGDPLRFDDQLVELRVQDVVLSDGAADHMLKTADFVDALLEQYYGMPPFYHVDDRQDLVGELVFGMAPHTSAAVVGRVVGFTSAAVGYAHPYFHAAKRRNCFHPETKLWYEDEEGHTRHERIEEFVERYLDEDRAETDNFGTQIDHLDGFDGELRVPSLDSGGSQTLKQVEAVSKHPAPDHMVRVRTRSGRELTITPDHEVHVYDADLGRLVPVEARKLHDNHHLVTPRRLDSLSTSEGARTFDLLAEFIGTDDIDDGRLMVKGLQKDRLYDLFTDRLADEREGRFYPLQSTAEYLETTKKSLSSYLYRESIPVSLLQRFFETTDDLLAFVPRNVTLGMKHDRAEIDRTVELDERVATLLGYYAAEGFTRVQQTPKGTIHQTTICGTEQMAREFFLDVFREEFGVDPYEENYAKITVSGRLLRVFFDSILELGSKAETKGVPQSVFDSSDAVVGAYLAGYFSGDGSVESAALVVDATTVSSELRDDLVGLLSRLGIKAHVEHIEPVPLHTKFPDDYTVDDPSTSAPSYALHIRSENAVKFHERVGFHLDRKATQLENHVATREVRPQRVFDGGTGDYLVEPIDSIEITESDLESVYCLTIQDTHSLVVNDLSAKQCDGDEDCVMLLMDGLLNFSKSYLPDQRGGSMDAPLVMSSRIDPSEIDDEAHNVDVVREYSREFYEATRRMADPGEVDVTIAEEYVGTDREYSGFGHTHDTSDIAAGPDLSAYKTLGSMMDKMDAQLELARKLRAVDETDVAERVIEYHFLPDLIGNLRAFSRQETRCLECGEKYRRVPLSGHCRECGADRMTLTVHQGSVTKYMDTAKRVAEEYGCRDYTKQRLEVLEKSIESVFENDKNKQSGIADFM